MGISISKAIEIMELEYSYPYQPKEQDLHDSIRISISALKRCRALAQESPIWALHPLPGETTD